MLLIKIRKNIYIDYDKIEAINTGINTVFIGGKSYTYDEEFSKLLKEKGIIKETTEFEATGCGI